MTEIEMPRYISHKEVWALKIKNIYVKEDGFYLVPENEKYAEIRILSSWLSKHDPQIGGYYVVYKDGYTSYSPCEAFEAGYTKV